MTMVTEKVKRWRMKVEHLAACNCNWGCPCSFDAPPSYGNCEGAVAFRVAEGRYGVASMDGLKWAFAASWPGAIHEGRGRAVVFLDEGAKGEARDGLEAIATGKAGGPIGILMSTVTAGMEVRPAKIDFHFAGKESSFRIGDEVRVEYEAMKNPVTGQEHFAEALLPTGLLTKREEFFSAKTSDVRTGMMSFSYPGRSGLAFRTTWRGP